MPEPTFKPVSLSGADPAGVLHTDGRRYLRGIHEAYATEIRQVIESGLIEALSSRALFPATAALNANVPDELKRYSLVLEHEAIRPMTYPREWSFGMVKATGLAFLEMLEEAWRRGYTSKDAHLFNFLFQGTRPKWVDIGSFARHDRLDAPLPWLAEFNSGILAPLRMWADGSAYLARSAIRHPSTHLPTDEFLAYRYPWLRGRSAFTAKARWLLGWRSNAASIREVSARATIFRALFAKKAPGIFRDLRNRIEPLECPPSSAWGDYQDEYLDGNGKVVMPRRFERIVELVGQHRPQSVLELAGNSGVLSQVIAERYPGTRVICSDCDAAAIDRLFGRVKSGALPNLSAAVLDFMVPEYTTAEIAPEKRFAGDCVLALAVTHHLLLSQGYDYDTVFAKIRGYTKELAFVEFMPLGLHDGRSAPPLPGWYNLDAFNAAFSRHFERLHVEQLDENRILLVGRVARDA